MKEKLFKAVKIVLIIFGIIFLIQILLLGLIVLGIISLGSVKTFNFNFDKIQNATKPKEILPIVNYVEDYQLKNKKYPEKLENVKVKDGLNYKYEVTKDGNCYSIKIEEKSTNKQYQHCKTASDNATSTSESYVEYSK